MKATTFTTSRVTLLDRIVEAIRMKRYMREFRKAKAQRTAVMNELREERQHLILG
jgi:hypothetical protein